MYMDKGSHLQDRESLIYKSKKTYQALTESLTYAAMSMWPDIGYITQFLSQTNKNPTQHDWNAAKRVLRYLKGTKDMGTMFQRDPDMNHIQHSPMTPWWFWNTNYAKTHVTISQQVAMCSCLLVVLSHGSQRDKCRCPYQLQKQSIMCWVLHVKKPLGWNK